MAFPRKLLIGSVVLFGVIGASALFKKKEQATEQVTEAVVVVEEKTQEPEPFEQVAALPKTRVVALGEEVESAPEDDGFPFGDRIFQLFTLGPQKLPVVETISYTSHVPWLKGRPAWVADYANYYNTSRHFIARSLNGKPDYLSQKVVPGSKFNVLRKDKNIQFHLLVDLTLRKMAFYMIDLGTNERTLLKTYVVGVGREDPSSPSGALTPLGKFSLDNKVAIYKPGDRGFFHDEKVEMVSVYGTRWVPFKETLEGATASCRGLGLHGAPWEKDEATGEFKENRDSVGKYVSGGGIRLLQEDIEEIVAITVTKPTVIEIVRDYRKAELPGIEKQD